MKLKPKQRRSVTNWINTTNYSNRKIAHIENVSPTTVANYRRKINLLGLDSDKMKSFDDLELAAHFLQKPADRDQNMVMPDFINIHDRKTRFKHLTLRVLHEEYKVAHKERAYCYSQFTHYYRKFIKKLDLSMRLNRYPGEAMFVDYAGTLIPYRDAATGIDYKAQIFVAVLGWSGLIFVHASRTQKVEDFIGSHIKAVEFFGGTPEVWIPDNLKSAVVNANRDALVLNQSYSDCAAHYDAVILPARVAKPQDKGLAEQAVLHSTRWITTPLLERTFFSLEEINTAILELLPNINNRLMRDYNGSRQSRYEGVEKSELKSLPNRAYEFGEWLVSQKVPSDYHIKVKGNFYSVPFSLVSERVEVKVSLRMVGIFQNSKLVASHIRHGGELGGCVTDPNHMPPNHLAYAKQGLDYYSLWAKNVGPNTLAIVQAQYEGRRENSIIANKACSSLKRLSRPYSVPDFEAACGRAIDIGSPSVTSIDSILKTGLYKLDQPDYKESLPAHENVRGASYYQIRSQ